MNPQVEAVIASACVAAAVASVGWFITKRQLLESGMPEAQFEMMQRELVLVVRSYVRACVGQ